MTCFNNNYVIPAGVCFYSLLKNANPLFDYKIYVLHSDISEENQKLLRQTIDEFKNGELIFKNMQNRCVDIFEQTKIKGFYSKEMFYKFLAPNLFVDYDKIIITDVDVCFVGDISKEFLEIDLTDSYIGAFKVPLLKGGLACEYLKHYEKDFTKEEQEAIQYAGGYYIYNLKKMREDNLEAKFFSYIKKYSNKVIQPEQDTINITCYPHIKPLKANALVCAYFYDTYKTEDDFKNDLNYSEAELRFALENPIQLHYATHVKPWNVPSCTMSKVWYEYLIKTPFYNLQMSRLQKKEDNFLKKIFSLKFGKKRLKLLYEIIKIDD